MVKAAGTDDASGVDSARAAARTRLKAFVPAAAGLAQSARLSASDAFASLASAGQGCYLMNE